MSELNNFLGEIQSCLIAAGHSPPDWPTTRDDSPLESATTMIGGLLMEITQLRQQLAELKHCSLDDKPAPNESWEVSAMYDSLTLSQLDLYADHKDRALSGACRAAAALIRRLDNNLCGATQELAKYVNGPSFMGEPVIGKAQPESGEAVGELRHVKDATFYYGDEYEFTPYKKGLKIGTKLYTHPAPVVPLKEHCQNGRADICLAGSQDGICCPDDECDIDEGLRKAAQEKEPLLKAAGHIQTGCYCKPGRCIAPVVMGRQTKCLDPNKAAQEQG